MFNDDLAWFYERDIGKLIEEINSFRSEDNLWKTVDSIKNSSGNLALHIIGGLNHLIGATLLQTGYVRNREIEFVIKGIERAKLIAELEALIPMIHKAIGYYTKEQLEEAYPIFFDKPDASIRYVLVQLLLHLNYHTGQVNYLRRSLE
jgi:Protein of unknown function (DUF1572)